MRCWSLRHPRAIPGARRRSAGRRGGFVQEFKGYEVIEKEVANGGNSARVFVPKKWVGKHVKIVLMEPVGEEPTD